LPANAFADVMTAVRTNGNRWQQKAPGFGDRRKAMLEDIACLTGGKVIAEEVGMSLEKATLADLGSAKRIEVGKENTIIIDGAGAACEIEAPVKQAVGTLKGDNSDQDAGIKLVMKAIEAPLREIVFNGGGEASVVVAAVMAEDD
jgi:chaperonin GroEL (HSP60 family)